MGGPDHSEYVRTLRMFGARLQEMRAHAGYTQESLADAVGKTRSAVEKLENGRTCPDLWDLLRLAALLEVTMDDLLDITDHPARDTEKRRALRALIRTVRHDDPATIEVIRKFRGFVKTHLP